MNRFEEEFGKIVAMNVIDIKPSIAISHDRFFYDLCDKVAIVATERDLVYRPVMGLNCNEGFLSIEDRYDIVHTISIDYLKTLVRNREEFEGEGEYFDQCFKTALKELKEFGVKIVE